MKTRLLTALSFVVIITLLASSGIQTVFAQEPQPTPSPEIPDSAGGNAPDQFAPKTPVESDHIISPRQLQATAAGETIIVPFQIGADGVQTSRSYAGLVTVTISGVGQAAGTQFSDAFYLYSDSGGLLPDTFYNWTLWINGGPAVYRFVDPVPPYSPEHIYTFTINVPSGPLTFAVGDINTSDNTGFYTVIVGDGGGPGPTPVVVSASTAGHFPNDWLQCSRSTFGDLLCSSTAAAPLNVSVTGTLAGGIQITLLPDETSLGQIQVSEILNGRIPIPTPPKAEERIVSVRADIGSISAISEPLTLYSSQLLNEALPITLTPSEVEAYDWQLIEKYGARPGVPSPGYLVIFKLLHVFLNVWADNKEYDPSAGDVFSRSLFQYDAPNVPTAYTYYERVERNGTLVYSKTLWSENRDDFTELLNHPDRRSMVVSVASPVGLFIVDPLGQGAGFDPATQQLRFDFPVLISDIGDEPYKLIVPSPIPGQYILHVIGTGSGPYALTVYGLDQNGQATPSQSVAGQINVGAITEYKVNFFEGATDLSVGAVIDIDPDTLNLKGKGRWITAYIELSQGLDVSQIQTSSIRLQGVISAEQQPSAIDDYDADGTPDLMVKFDRQTLTNYLKDHGLISGQVSLEVSGELGALSWSGVDAITIRSQ